MPTKRAFLVFLFSLLLLLGAWISKLVWIYFSFSAAIGIIVLGYLFSKLLILNLQIKRHLQACVYEDDIVTVIIEIRNKIPMLDQSLEIKDLFTAADAQSQEKNIYLNGMHKGVIKFSYQERCFKRGKYIIGPFKVKVFEPLGLFYLSKEIRVYSTLIVYPKIFTVQKLPFVLGHIAPRFGEQTTRISGDYEEFYGIREYQKEDGWRRIHWPSTARLDELMVRHFEQSSQWKTLFVLDAADTNNVGYGKDTTFEYAVKVVASCMKYLFLRNASFGLIASSKKPVNIAISKGESHFNKILEELVVINPDGTEPVHKLIATYQWIIPQSACLLIATNNFNPQLIRFLRYLKIQKNIGIISAILNSNSFMVDRKSNPLSMRLDMIKKTYYDVSSQIYLVDCKDDLRVHFAK
ncbi:MAG: DUF58 domain-containing protein [Candidatus Omnitrophica bacterium]|nr:DUF58 domain-containing protein [Candidatus Omnitrophota bacterium]